VFQRATQTYLWALPLLNTMGMKDGSERVFGRLNGANDYTVTFSKDRLLPARGFWSRTLYNEHHFFYPNEQHRFSLGKE
jgi:hypothetical protein